MVGFRRSTGKSAGELSSHKLIIWSRGVRLFGYWTMSNLPLFFLAAPMIYMLLHSGVWAWYSDVSNNTVSAGNTQGESGAKITQLASADSPSVVARALTFRYAVPQIVLAVLALTTYHVQVITRISSGYPVLYWWLASLILRDQKSTWLGVEINNGTLITRWMVIYAVVQGGLFAAFLPPA